MRKRWLAWAVLCGACLMAPAMVSAEVQGNPYAEQAQADDADNAAGIAGIGKLEGMDGTAGTEQTGSLDSPAGTGSTAGAEEAENADRPGIAADAAGTDGPDCADKPQGIEAAVSTDGAACTDGKEDSSYQAIESTDAYGLKIIANPLWEQSGTGKAYKLVKTKNVQGGTTYYTLSDGVLQLGDEPGYYYAFDENGDMITAVRTINKIRYYFTPASQAVEDTAAVTPNQTTLGRAVQDRWEKIDGKWYYFNGRGQQDLGKTGLQKINGSYYYLNKSAVPAASKWVRQQNGAWWYFGKNGKYNSSLINSRKINGAYYYLNKKGIPCRNCFKTVKNKKYYYGASGRRAAYTGWKAIKKKQYYFSKKHYVVTKTGWQAIKGKSYYFSPKGSMYAKQWATIGGKQYYFKANGQMATGWAKINGTYYYFTKSGTLDRSTVAKQGKNYYFVTAQGTRGANILSGVGVTNAMSNATKLRVCFNYVVNNCRYMGGQVWPPRGWEPYHAYKMLTMRMGNCYDFAAAFCYLAKAVGYEGMICITGQCASASGGYTPHSWCEFGGMVFDPEISYEEGLYLFNVSYGNLPFGYIR